MIQGETEEFTSYRVLYYVYTDNFLGMDAQQCAWLDKPPSRNHLVDVRDISRAAATSGRAACVGRAKRSNVRKLPQIFCFV